MEAHFLHQLMDPLNHKLIYLWKNLDTARVARPQTAFAPDNLLRMVLLLILGLLHQLALSDMLMSAHAGGPCTALVWSCFKAHGNFLGQKNPSSLEISKYFGKHISLSKNGWRASHQCVFVFFFFFNLNI